MDKELIKQENVNKERIPQIALSASTLEITVEEGRVYRDVLVIESTNQIPLEGNIYSTNDKVETEVREIHGLRQEIPFYFKGKLAVAGNEWQGDLVLVTNGGEFNVPYRVHVVPKRIRALGDTMENMEGFVHLYQTNRKEACELFFLPAFEEAFLKEDPENCALYHSMMKSRSRNLIVEEFLAAAGFKEIATLSVEEKILVLDVGKEKDTIRLQLLNDGYLEGRVSCEKGQIGLGVKRFNSDDFVNGEFFLTVEKNKNIVMGSDVIHIDTVRQSFVIPVEWWGTLPAVSRQKENERLMRRRKAELMHNYLYFRTGSIGEDDFFEDTMKVLDDLYLETEDIRWQFYRLNLYLMQQQMEPAGELLKKIEEDDHEVDPLMAHYLLYLKAMYYRTQEAIHEAVIKIRAFYENSFYKAESLWMLIYLDREYVYNKRLQYETMKQLFESGINSSLLYYEACEILNDNPDYMEELGSFEINMFRWGLRYGFVSMPLSTQFARLALKQKYFSKAVFYITRKLYSIQKEDIFLQVICSLLIKGNRISKEYHQYFKDAVDRNLKIVGLNEFFIRSMDYSDYAIIPQKVLVYFTYSNSLDYNEKAYLYTNVYKNQELYDEVFGAYYSKMIPFAQEQLLKGRISEHLAFLYTCFQKEIMEAPENWKAVCDIMFFRKLTCKNRNMIGVYVSCPETGEETYTPLSQGSCYVEIFNQRSQCFFVDSAEQRYVAGIDYDLQTFLTVEQFPKRWVEKNLTNKKVLLEESGRLDKTVEADELPIMHRIVFNDDYKEWMRKTTLERLLRYYENHQEKEELAKWLKRIDYSNISASFRKTLMDYYMETGMIEEAFFGIELYGCTIMGASKRLKLAVFGIRHNNGKHDDTTISLAYSAFIRKKYNKDTLEYLMEYFSGEMEDLLLIWERSRKFELDTAAFEKRILAQSMFTSSVNEGLFPVYASLYESSPEEEILGKYLAYISAREVSGTIELPDYMHRVIGQEILHGRITDHDVMVRFLYYFAGKTTWYDQIKDAVCYIIGLFLEEELYLPVYHTYEHWVRLPINYEEMTFLTYYGSPGKTVCLNYEIDGEEDSFRQQYLTEVLPGMYVCHLYFYQKDHVNYRLEEDGAVQEDPDRLKFETFPYEGEDSRFFALNALSESNADLNMIDQYLLKAFFADEYINRME